MKQPLDYTSRHEYDVKGVHNVHMDGSTPGRQPVSAEVLVLYGFNPIPAGGAPVTNDLVNKLREELEI